MTIRFSHEQSTLIARTPPFRDLSGADIAAILAHAAVSHFPANATLFFEGDRVENFFLLLSGQVKVFRVAPNGNENVLRVFGPGASFALTALFGGGTYPANCETLAASTVLSIRRSAMLDGLAATPRIGFGFINAIASSRDALLHEIAEIKGKTAVQRIAGFLLSLTEIGFGPSTVTLPFRRQVLAEKIGVTPEYLSRVFARFAAHGIRSKGNLIEIDDVAVLGDIHCGRLDTSPR